MRRYTVGVKIGRRQGNKMIKGEERIAERR